MKLIRIHPVRIREVPALDDSSRRFLVTSRDGEHAQEVYVSGAGEVDINVVGWIGASQITRRIVARLRLLRPRVA